MTGTLTSTAVSRGRHRRYRRRPGAEGVALVLGAAVLTVSSIIAADGVPRWEADVFHAVNDLPDWLRGPAWVVQLVGMMGVPIILAVLALARRRWRLALALALLTPVKYLVEHEVVKRLVERQRPAQSICGGDLSCGHFRGAPLQGLSFVSGHAVILGGLAWLLLPYLGRRARVAVVLVAFAGLVARVYIGAHNPLDVIGGAGLGVAIAAAFNLVVGVPARWRHHRRPGRRRPAARDSAPQPSSSASSR